MNKYKKYLKIAKEVSKKYHKMPGLVGIIWIGSSSYEICDKSADIDLQLVVSKKDKDFSMQQFRKKGVKIEVDKMDLGWLLKRKKPDSEQFWIREKAKVVYDPKGILETKFEEKNKIGKGVFKKILWSLYKDIFHSYDFEKCIKRGEKIAGLMYFFKTLNALSKFTFIYNQQPVPTFKWRWHFIKEGKLLKKNIIKDLENLKTFNPKDTLKMVKKIEAEVQEMISEKGYPDERVKEPWLF